MARLLRPRLAASAALALSLSLLPATAAFAQQQAPPTGQAAAGSQPQAAPAGLGGLDTALEDARAEYAAATRRLAELEDKLSRASDRLAAVEKEYADASAAAQAARLRARSLTEQLRAAEAALERDRQRLRVAARDAYKHGMGTDPLLATLSAMPDSGGPADLAHLQHKLEAALGDRADAVAALVEQVNRVAQLRAQAEDARRERRRELAAARTARAEAARLHAELEQGLDAAVEDRERQAELLAAITGERGELEARLDELSVLPASSPDLATVGGITVARELAPSLRALLAAARADGIELSGWGWRSPQRQIELRRINGCPDVHSSPASSCRVPTARPGQSQHESGLAVDFTWQGETLCYPLRAAQCRGRNPAFDWLDENAHRYGLQVLSSEAWHWSTTGR